MRSLLWVALLTWLGLLIGGPIGIVVGNAVSGEDRPGWIAILAVVVGLLGLAGRIAWRPDRGHQQKTSG